MTQDEAKAKVEKAGAEFIDSGLHGLDYAASDDIAVMQWLLDTKLIKSINRGGTIKYNGVIDYDPIPD